MAKFRVLPAVLLSAALLAALCAPARAYLRIHPENPHYFQETSTGKAVVLTGYGSIVPGSAGWDYNIDIDYYKARRMMDCRAWHLSGYGGGDGIMAYGLSGTSGAYWGGVGGNKVDMNTWNPVYWNRMNDALAKCNAGGIYVPIMLFDRCWMSPPEDSRWGDNPWAKNNNINNLEVPNANPPNEGTPAFYGWSTKPNLRAQQERWVAKMIDETIDDPNVWYEIENEHWASPSVGWADHYSQFVKNYIAAHYPDSPRLVTYSTIESDADLDSCFAMASLDVINRHYGAEPETTSPSIINTYLEPRWSYNKAISVDEFANGVTDYNILRQECWTILTSGGNFHIEDPYPEAKPYDVVENIRSFLALSGWDFIHSAPNKALITSGGGYCMAQPGVEYFCYFPTGGSKTISLTAGTYRAEWWNPRTGGFYNVTSFIHTSGGRALSSPDSSDWVLHITTKAAPAAIMQSRIAASALTIDGNSGDWNLSEFGSKIPGGSAGSGQIAWLGYDTNGICHSGGHSTSMQFPPANAADLAVRAYSRNDTSYVYFLVRLDDSDIRYPNALASNNLNDCVQFYIDPANDGGSSAMSNSASDVQLVIDANNQKNVYGTTGTYKTTVLNGITSAVVRDASGWWLEVRIAKNALSPVIPGAGRIGLDLAVRDNDANDTAQSTILTWSDPETSGSCPTTIPARWGDLTMQASWDTLGSQIEVGNGYTPGVAVDSQGNIHVVFMGGGNIYYRKIDGSTLVPGAIEQIPNPEGAGGYCCACVKCDANDIPHVVFQKGWAGESHRNWYSNRIGGAWKTPVKIIDNNIQLLDGRANYPRMALYGSYAYVATFGVPGEMADGSEGTIVRVTNLSTTPVVDRTGYTPLWVPHPMITSDGRLFVSGRHTTQGYKYQEFSPTTLQPIGNMILLTGGMDRYPGEENAACLDRQGTIHGVGAYNTSQGTAIWRGRIFYNSSTRAAAGQPPIVGLEGTDTWDSIQVYPTIAADPELRVYISWWFHPTGEGKITKISGSAYATPVTYAAHVTEYMRWNPQIAATPTGGVFAAWDYGGKCYIRGIGVGSYLGGGAPGPVTNFTAVGGPTKAVLSWRNPGDASFVGTMIRYKTTGYPTGPTDGTLVADKSGTAGADSSVTHTGLTDGLTYYYSAFAHDAQSNCAAKVDASATPHALTSVTLDSKPAGAMVIDGSNADWNLADFTSKVRAGIDPSGDYAITGYDSGALFCASYWTSASLPSNAADHTAKVYSRHDANYLYFLVRCDDSDIRYSDPASSNWANDCVEFYIDPGHDHGSTALTEPGTSASDIELVIDANNQKNVYCSTGAYRTAVLAGVTSAVVRDATGWWLEARISKSALNPDMPYAGTVGIEFAFRDNDNNNDLAASSMYVWTDSVSGAGFPRKVPDAWANLTMQPPPDYVAPGPVTSFVATAGDEQVSLSWHNPSDVDFAGTMIRCSTGAYPTSPTDGALVIDKANSPNSNDSFVHTGLTNGTRYYYSAFARDAALNYATSANATAIPADTTAPGPVTGFTAVQGNGRNFLTWTNPAAADLAGVKVLSKTTGYPTGPADGTVVYEGTATSCSHDGLANGTTCYYAAYAYDEVPNHSSAAQTSAEPVYIGPVQAKLLGDNTPLTLTAGVVSAIFPGFFYVQCVGPGWGACGVKVAKLSHGLQVGQSVTAKGTILTDPATGERYIAATWVNGSGSSTVAPLGVTNQTLGGSDWSYSSGTGAGQQGVLDGHGTNTIGLRVRVWGKVTQRDESGLTYFYIDDGSGLRDTTKTGAADNVGVRVKGKPTGYAAGTYALVTGISSCLKDESGNIRPLILLPPTDVIPPAPVTNFAATSGTGHANLTWTNPTTSDWAGTMIRFKTTGYPTGPADGTQCYNGTGSSFNHAGLTNGATYYYCAYTYDAEPNYSAAAQVSATPAAPALISNSTFSSTTDGWATSVWRSGDTYDPGAMAWLSSGGNPGGCMQSTGYGLSDSDDRCLREGGEMSRVISTQGYAGVKVYYDLKVDPLGGSITGVGSGSCSVDHNLVDEQLTVFYSTNGGVNWIEAGYLLRSALLASYQSFGTRIVDLTGISACNNNPNFALRFRWQFNQATDTGWLDNVKVEVNN